VTLGSIDGTPPPPPGGTRAVDEGGKVGVYLNEMAGNPIDGVFYLSVTCPS
jgi:hypothetical protein